MEDEAVGMLANALRSLVQTRETGRAMRALVEQFDWSLVAPRYDEWMESIDRS